MLEILNRRIAQPAIALTLALFLAACASIDSKDTDRYIFLEETDLLFIDFKYSQAQFYDPDFPDMVVDSGDNRRQDFLQALEQLLFEYQLPLKTYILKEGDEPIYGPVLEVTALRLDQDNTGDYVATVQARLKKRGETNTLGTYTERETPPMGGSSHHADQAYRDVIRKPLQKMLNDLLRHFPSPEEQEILDASTL